LGFALQNGRPFFDPSRRHNVNNLHPNEIASAQFAIDSQVEKSKVSVFLSQFKPHSDRPDVLGFEREFLADNATFVPSRPKRANGR
jgi:hypothetical protein